MVTRRSLVTGLGAGVAMVLAGCTEPGDKQSGGAITEGEGSDPLTSSTLVRTVSYDDGQLQISVRSDLNMATDVANNRDLDYMRADTLLVLNEEQDVLHERTLFEEMPPVVVNVDRGTYTVIVIGDEGIGSTQSIEHEHRLTLNVGADSVRATEFRTSYREKG